MNKFIEVPATKRSLTLRKKVFGVGINDSDYMTQRLINGKRVKCPFYVTWVHMIERCYHQKFKNRHLTYTNCSMEAEWLIFSVFKDWMINQEWEGRQLDKDIKFIGNKIYSAENCLFVSQKINNLLIDSAAKRGEFPIGVYFKKLNKKFTAQCSYNGKEKHIGLFDTPEAAHEAYKSFKYKVILEAASLPENEYIREHLLNHAELINT